jgi:hypothetical protein
MKVGEPDAPGSQRVEGRCFHWATVTTDILPSQVIGQQQDDIGMPLSRKTGCGDGDDKQCEKDSSDHVTGSLSGS